MKNFDPSNIYQDDKDYIEEVNDNWETLITDWIQDYKNGIQTKEYVLSVTEKVARYRGDNDLVEMTKQRMGLV